MRQNDHELVTAEEITAFGDFIDSCVDDDQVKYVVTYNYKTSETINYDTGAVSEVGAGTGTVNGILLDLSRKQMDAMNVQSGNIVVLIQKADLDSASITPQMWENCTIDSKEYEIKEIFLPIPHLHYKLVLSLVGKGL